MKQKPKTIALFQCVALLCLWNCVQNHKKDASIANAQHDTSTRPISAGHAKASMQDTISNYLKENILYIPFIDLAFCKTELLREIHTNRSFRDAWADKMNKFSRLYTDSLSYITVGKEIDFFRQCLMSMRGAQGYDTTDVQFVLQSLPKGYDMSSFDSDQYRTLLLQYQTADGGLLDELSAIYYTLLVIDGTEFIYAAERDSACAVIYKEWLDKLCNYEFAAYADGFTPPQVLERKRSYVVQKLTVGNDKLSQLTVNKIKNCSLRVID